MKHLILLSFLVSLLPLPHSSLAQEKPEADPAILELFKTYSTRILESGLLTQRTASRTHMIAHIDATLRSRVDRDFAVVQSAYVKVATSHPALIETLVRWSMKRGPVRDVVVTDAISRLRIEMNKVLPGHIQLEFDARHKNINQVLRAMMPEPTHLDTVIRIGMTKIEHGQLPAIEVSSDSNAPSIGWQSYSVSWSFGHPLEAKQERRFWPHANSDSQSGYHELRGLEELLHALKQENLAAPAQFQSFPGVLQLIESEALRKEWNDRLKDFSRSSR